MFASAGAIAASTVAAADATATATRRAGERRSLTRLRPAATITMIRQTAAAGGYSIVATGGISAAHPSRRRSSR